MRKNTSRVGIIIISIEICTKDMAKIFVALYSIFYSRVWDRETMLSQFAKRSIRGLVSGLSKAAVCFALGKSVKI